MVAVPLAGHALLARSAGYGGTMPGMTTRIVLRGGSALGYYDGNIVTEQEYKRLNEDTGLRHTLRVQGGRWLNGLHGVTGMQFANTALGRLA